MALILIVLLLILILGGVGIAVAKLLLWIALILLAIWLIGFFVRGAEGARWYRWLLQVIERVHGLAVHANLEVQVRAEAVTGAAHIADHLALRH
jgi:hypothetical protein